MRKVRIIYISGPMTGIPLLNFPAFHAAANQLRIIGLNTINPAEVNPDLDASRYICLRHDLAALTHCDAVALLPGWEHSPGARRELENALAMGFIVAPLDAWLVPAQS